MTYIFSITYPESLSKEDFSGLFFEVDSEGFEEKEDVIELYLNETQLEAGEQFVDALCSAYALTCKKSVLENKNWNEQWEQSFQPLNIDNLVYIHATFHPANTAVKYDIIIEPKMSFGTGHHPTTWQMMKNMSLLDLTGKSVLDCGSGTGILAILAEKMGAESCIALDNDEWCYRNCLENIALNHTQHIKAEIGGIEHAEGMTFDCILANIHRNYLLENMGKLSALVKINGNLLVSGFYADDAKAILDKALEHGLIANYESVMENWECIVLQKK